MPPPPLAPPPPSRRRLPPAGQGVALDAARTLAATLAMLLALAALRPALAGLPETGALALSVAAGGLAFLLTAAGTGALRGWRLPLPLASISLVDASERACWTRP